MKRQLTLLYILLFCATLSYAQKTLTILHTNDTHSTILPLNAALSDTLVAGRGGYLRRIAMLKEERQKDPQLLLFDSGDFSQGSPYYTLFKGDVEVELMNQMHYDAVAIGNHEFDYGLDNLARLIKKLKCPVVCANYDFTGTPCEGLVRPYIILHRKGIKIGVMGLSTVLDGLVDHKNYQQTRYQDPVEVAQRVSKELKEKKKCDLVICISHLGWGTRTTSDQDVSRGTKYIDLILGGHSHTYLPTLEQVSNAQGRPVYVDQNGKHAIYVGKMSLEMSKK